MRLKDYQKRVLFDLDTFLRYLDQESNISKAYAMTWLDNGITIGGDGMPAYRDTIPQVPHICFKVPTGGGKTVIACASLKHIYDALERMMASRMQDKIVVWLVPSNAILEQTLAALKNPNHPYRQQIDGDFASRVEVLDGVQARNGQNFTPATVRENLTILVMSFDALRIRKKEGRKAYQENGNLDGFVASYDHPETMIPDAEVNALMQVLNQKSPVVIIDESHNAQSELSVEMLKNLNPSFVLDLTATPRSNSNIISIVDARELKRENMVKLPIIVYNRSSQNDVVHDAIALRANLERKAKDILLAGGSYIRPIVLFQAQPRTSEDAATFERLKKILVDGGIPEEQIAIKTSEINELRNVDLMSRECQVRYIITVNALKEGWDCPFAYVLATVANRSSRVDVEQIVGRILRLPYTRRHNEPTLNMSYVLTSSDDFDNTVHEVIKGLNQAGFTDHDYRAVDTSSESSSVQTAAVAVQVPVVQVQTENPNPAQQMDTSEGSDIIEIDIAAVQQGVADTQAETPFTGENVFSVETILHDAEQQEQQFEAEIHRAEEAGVSPVGGDEMRHRFEMQTEYEYEARALKLPQFVKDVGASLFTSHEKRPVSKEALSEGFTLADKDIQISFVMSESDMMKVDIDSGSKPRSVALQEREALRFKEFIKNEPEGQKRPTLAYNLYMKLNRLDFVTASDLRGYVDRIVNNLSAEDLEKASDALPFYAERIRKKIMDLVDEYREKLFYRLIETGVITVEPTWSFPQLITPVPTMLPLDKALYTDEGEVNHFELKVIKYIASLDNVVWWHRNIERRGFCLNGFINHYPDFIVKTTRGNIVLVETKGDDRDNSDSKQKLSLGTKWADMAGSQYRYYMVFDEADIGVPGAYRFTEFGELIKHL